MSAVTQFGGDVEEHRLNLNREDYLTALRAGVCTVVFRKANGTLRTMKATLQQSVVESVEAGSPPKQRKVTEYDTQQLRVIDTEKNEWRSFKIGDVVSFITGEIK